MKNTNRNSSFRGKDKREDRGSDRGGDRQMHRATCADCGRSCEVPFRPTGDKPVYCSYCFQSERKSKGDDRAGHDRSRQTNFVAKQQPEQSIKKYAEINAKLDKILYLLQNTQSPAVADKVVAGKEVAVKKAAVKKTVVKKKVVTKKAATNKREN